MADCGQERVIGYQMHMRDRQIVAMNIQQRAEFSSHRSAQQCSAIGFNTLQLCKFFADPSVV